MIDNARATISSYLSSETESEAIAEFDAAPEIPAQIMRVGLLGDLGDHATEFDINTAITIKTQYMLRPDLSTHRVGINIWSEDGTLILETASSGRSESLTESERGEYSATLTIPANFLAPGQYVVSTYLDEQNIKVHDNRYYERILRFGVSGNPFHSPERRRGLLIYPFNWETARTSKTQLAKETVD